MKKKIISILIVTTLIVAFVAGHLITYAGVAETPLYVNLMAIYPTDLTDVNNPKGVGYGIGDADTTGKHIWHVATNDSETGPLSAEQRNLYCVNADHGQTWYGVGDTVGDQNQILGYEIYYDIQDNIANLAKSFENSTVLYSLLNPEGTQYRQLLWLFDNFYVPEENEDIDKFLAKAGIYSGEDENGIYYYKKQGETQIDYPTGDGLTEADIIAVQKMAIWYFTNNTQYNYTSLSNWLTISENGGAYLPISDSRNAMAMDLYKYLINSAQDGATQYKAENGYKLDDKSPVSVNGITGINETQQVATAMTRSGDNYLVGPIEIEENNDLGYDISVVVSKKVSGQEGYNTLTENTDYIYTDINGTPLQNITSQKDLIGIDGGFYVSVPRSLVENVKISVSIKYKSTPKKLWLYETKDEDGNVVALDSEQPLVEITQDPKEVIVELISQPEEFDLALRKYITEVNGTNTRVPNISLDTLQKGTTATYNHRKDPVVVEENDIVTYSITIYNEGDKAGYASQIIDQLPRGLVLTSNAPVQSKGKDENGNVKIKNTYTVNYESSSNRITLTLDTTQSTPQSLQPYAETTGLDYETIEIQCTVAQEADEQNQIILTNVAWINEAYEYDEEQQIYVVSDNDRDSKPSTIPTEVQGSSAQDNITNYRGTTTEESLAREDFFYEGQEDDDDFEKLVIMPVEKKFDLALFKHIAAISKDQTIESGEYVTDNGNIDGTYLRAPVVTAIDPNTGKITYEQDDKAALTVEPGDYVLYTIRVYNEGEVNGYASEIKDTLPIGLEFVLNNEEYNGIWKLEPILDSEGRQVVTTTWYAKGQGSELDAEEGTPEYTANLLNALNKEGAVSNEEPANPDYIDAQVLCRVVEQATSSRVLVNYAQIADDSDENGEPIDDIDSTPNQWIDEDDDQDIERIRLQYFDLSLRKFITAINGAELTDSDGKYIREPVVNVSNLINGTGTTAVYTHSKTPLPVQVGDTIVYTIRVYNEGSLDGFANEVKDYLPPYLTYVEDSELNEQYEWQLSEDGRVVTTTYLANTELEAFNGTELDYADLKIECIIAEDAPLKQSQTNIAEVSEYKYNGSIVDKDIDSTADNMVSKDYLPSDEELPTYKDEEINNSYIPGNEDDDDFEKVYVKQFDLALRKFITQIQENEVTTRIPQVDTTPLRSGEDTAAYTHPKDALTVHIGDVVIYTLRIYNEGEISGYASEITDDIPEYLEYLPENSTNVEYMWKMYDENGNETENVEDAVKVTTTYLSKENGEDNLINAFDGETLSYKDIKIAFKVKDPNSNTYIITNYAQISNDTDGNGNPVEDKDSTPDEWIDNEQHKDDDQDIENVKVEYFDLSILKFVSKVIIIEDGKEKITETGYNGHENPEPVVKVELHKKKLNNVVVKFGYGITVTNEGDIPGYATELTDYVPEGLKFDPNDNPEWTDEGNNVISTRQIENKLLQPGESTTVEVIFTWINGADNLALKTNTVEISEDKNEYDVPDRDSTPDNKQDGEDDIDIAKVILSVSTGAAKTYFVLTLGLLTIVLVGVVLIKKFVI